MKVFFVYRTARNSIWHEYEKKRGPSTFLYGLPELKHLKIETAFSDIAWHPTNLLRPLLQPLEKLHQYLLNYPIGFQLHQALLLMPEYQFSDFIVTTQDSAGLPILLLKKMRLVKPKVVYISNGLANALINARSKPLLRIISGLLCSADKIICYSRKEKQILEQFTHKSVTFIPFGIDIKFFSPPPKLPTTYDFDIFSGGKDSYRDYKCLFSAVKNTKWRVVVACTPENVQGLTPPSNVTLRFNVDSYNWKRLYEISRLVVIPMMDTDKTQGQAVFLEAVAMNKPVVSSKVSAITDAFEVSKFKEVMLVPSGAPHLLKTAIETQLKKQSRTLQTGQIRVSISTQVFANKLVQVIESLNNAK